MSEILVFGIDGRGLSEEHELLLRQCAVIVGSRRLAERIEAEGLAVAPITPLAAAFERIDAGLLQGHVGVLASGDPLYYGIGARIIERFGSERVRILPALSSLQEAFCRFKLSWTDATVVSLHGRKERNITGLLLRHRKTFIFTDPSRPPQMLAKMLIEYLTTIGETLIKNGCRVHVAEDLGSVREKITVGSLEEISCLQFSPLNVVCLLLPELPPPPVFGLEEKEIAHSRGLITKDEVRAATLHRLRLPRKGVFWDIGGGSGSVSLEAASMLPELSVYTVEHKV
ncbi:MAG TPA: precorrin-6y C5,15-methyltransferase (decarboxylating) subunit CbiE, partial [Desulfopila sp.]|nr:precorrin-6y C5,15-methyltransferase (decarboxylating) subunit CbiE [Desulfopila sp.]